MLSLPPSSDDAVVSDIAGDGVVCPRPALIVSAPSPPWDQVVADIGIDDVIAGIAEDGVIAGAGPCMLIAVAAMQLVIVKAAQNGIDAGPAEQRVIAGAAVDRIVAVVTAKPVGARSAPEAVVAGTPDRLSLPPLMVAPLSPLIQSSPSPPSTVSLPNRREPYRCPRRHRQIVAKPRQDRIGATDNRGGRRRHIVDDDVLRTGRIDIGEGEGRRRPGRGEGIGIARHRPVGRGRHLDVGLRSRRSTDQDLPFRRYPGGEGQGYRRCH